MEIPVFNIHDEHDCLTFRRLDDVVRILHRDKPIADIEVRDLLDHLARRSRKRWIQRQRRWREFTVGLTRDQKVVLAVRHRISTNTLTGEELLELWQLLSRDDTFLPAPRAGVAQLADLRPR